MESDAVIALRDIEDLGAPRRPAAPRPRRALPCTRPSTCVLPCNLPSSLLRRLRALVEKRRNPRERGVPVDRHLVRGPRLDVIEEALLRRLAEQAGAARVGVLDVAVRSARDDAG